MDTVASTTFATLLRRYRLAAGLTQEELAERANLSVRGVSDLERGLRTSPRPETVDLLASALGLAPFDRADLEASVSRRRGPVSQQPFRPLPAEPTSLIGREREEAQALKLLRERHVRLLTLTGPGGVGKTRLALRLARRLEAEFTGGAVFVSLASVRDPSLVAVTVATVLGLQPAPGQSAEQLLISRLGTTQRLLVLDNFEHLLDAAWLVAHLISSCPGLTLIVTSRAALRLQAEWDMEVHPLVTPPFTPRELDTDRFPAMALFLERARAVNVDLEMTEDTLPAVVEICRALDGLPLAIELAAAHVKMLSPEAILGRLEKRLPLLSGGPRDLPDRQRTMRDAISWSYNLLTSNEQAVFRRLAVFSGGCSVEAAEAVLSGMGLPSGGALAVIASLVDKSLLRVMSEAGESRYGMLEVVREFAEEQLRVAGEADGARRDHALHFLHLATTAEEALSGSEQAVWLVRLERDHDNLRGALEYALQAHDLALGLDLAGRLWPFWSARNHYDEAYKWLAAFLLGDDSGRVAPGIRARAMMALGTLQNLRVEGQLPVVLHQEALSLAQESGEEQLVAATLRQMARVESARANYPAVEDLLDQALGVYRGLQDQAGICAVLNILATVIRYRGAFDRATTLYQEALEIGRATGDYRTVADLLARWGTMETERGNPSRSFPMFEEALTLHRELGDSAGVGDIQLRSGETLASMGRYAEAMERYEESLSIFRDLRSTYAVAYVELFQAEAALGLGHIDRAEELARQVLEFFSSLGDRRSTADSLFQLADVAQARKHYEEASDLYAQSLREYYAPNARPGVARCLERLALLAAADAKMERAARLHGAARALRDDMGSEMVPVDREGYNRALVVVCEGMGNDAFTTAVREGEAMTLDQAVTYALDGRGA